jgi:hypothetical protein
MRAKNFEEDEIFAALWQANLKCGEEPGPEANIRKLAASICSQYATGTSPPPPPNSSEFGKFDEDWARPHDEAGDTNSATDSPGANGRPEAGTLITRRVSDVESKPVRWLWPYRIPRGKLTIIAGHPGLAKSQVTCYLAARVTAGGAWPDSGGQAAGGAQVVILTAEDDVADTVRPRLEAAGADLSRVHIADGVIRGYSGDGTRHQRQFSLESDLVALNAKLAELKRVELVVIDPISAYLGTIDSHVNAEVRGALGPVKFKMLKATTWPERKYDRVEHLGHLEHLVEKARCLSTPRLIS